MMPRFRPLLAVLIALTLGFSPVAGFAMTKSCQGMQQTIGVDGRADSGMTNDGGMADCPCHNAMPHCGTMPQCQTSTGCASQCMASAGIVSGAFAPAKLDHDALTFAAVALGHSLTIQPPAPPPRA